MSIIGIKSIPLERATNVAWKTVPDFWFIDRGRDLDSIIRHVNSRPYEAVLNLGAVDLRTDAIATIVYNRVQTIKAISHPKALRRTLETFVPESTTTYPHWHKSGGFGGTGTWFCNVNCHNANIGDTQRHVEGTEYRIVTVGENIVQASLKGERRTKLNGRNEFDYAWLGVDGIRQGGFIPFLKEAINEIPDGERSVIGWDVLHDGDQPWIIEANTCPGVNEATAKRIITEIRRSL